MAAFRCCSGKPPASHSCYAERLYALLFPCNFPEYRIACRRNIKEVTAISSQTRCGSVLAPYVPFNRSLRNATVIVRRWMTTDVVTIKKEASIQEALALMKQHSIRHLPVVNESMKLLGWATDADLRGVLIASMLEELTLEDIMVRKPRTAYPDMRLEEAAQLILERRIGGLPVVEEGKLIGVITVVDILSAFINIMGLLAQSSRLDVKVSSRATASLDKVTQLIQNHRAEIISICHLPTMEGQENVYSIRLRKCDMDGIVADMEKSGIEVVSSIP